MSEESSGGLASARLSDRVGMIILAAALWAIAAWMFWFVRKFAAGDGWWDFVVHLVLDEFAFAIAVLGLAFVAQAAFPKTAGKFVDQASQKVALIAFGLLGLFCASLVVVAFVGFVLTQLRLPH